jgi:hypothetical protein
MRFQGSWPVGEIIEFVMENSQEEKENEKSSCGSKM